MVSVPSLPPPPAMGFPAKFSTWRDAQIRAIDCTIASPKRFVAAVAPTGFGKALYGVAISRLMPSVERAAYLTSTKGLQDQIVEDFGVLDLADVRGQRNYPCIALDTGASLSNYRRQRGFQGCDEGPCHSGVYCPHNFDPRQPKVRPYCSYYGTVWDAQRRSLVNTNYAYWFSSGAYGQGLGDFELLVLDEAHNAVEELERFLVFELSSLDATVLHSKLPKEGDPTVWRQWAAQRIIPLNSRLELLESFPPTTAEEAQERRRLKGLQSRLDRLRQISPESWVVERDGTFKVRLSPLEIGPYAEDNLFRGVKKIVLMSATMTRKTLTLLGIPHEEAEVLEFPSTFDVERRPIIVLQTVPNVRVTYKMNSAAKHVWLRRIDKIIEKRQHLKGIVHTVSYQRAQDLIQQSEFKDLMIFHDSQTTATAVEAFKKHQGGCVLVSPSMSTGWDFPFDLCRYQVIGKVPLPDARGAIMEMRTVLDPEYPFYIAMQKLVQACGRAVRDEKDWAETFIVDDTFGDWFLRRAKKFAPKWFTDAIEYHDSFPLPLSFPDAA